MLDPRNSLDFVPCQALRVSLRPANRCAPGVSQRRGLQFGKSLELLCIAHSVCVPDQAPETQLRFDSDGFHIDQSTRLRDVSRAVGIWLALAISVHSPRWRPRRQFETTGKKRLHQTTDTPVWSVQVSPSSALNRLLLVLGDQESTRHRFGVGWSLHCPCTTSLWWLFLLWSSRMDCGVALDQLS